MPSHKISWPISKFPDFSEIYFFLTFSWSVATLTGACRGDGPVLLMVLLSPVRCHWGVHLLTAGLIKGRGAPGKTPASHGTALGHLAAWKGPDILRGGHRGASLGDLRGQGRGALKLELGLRRGPDGMVNPGYKWNLLPYAPFQNMPYKLVHWCKVFQCVLSPGTCNTFWRISFWAAFCGKVMVWKFQSQSFSEVAPQADQCKQNRALL